MSRQTQSKNRVKKFNIDKEARKYYPSLDSRKSTNHMPIYVAQKLGRFEVRYRPVI